MAVAGPQRQLVLKLLLRAAPHGEDRARLELEVRALRLVAATSATAAAAAAANPSSSAVSGGAAARRRPDA